MLVVGSIFVVLQIISSEATSKRPAIKLMVANGARLEYLDLEGEGPPLAFLAGPYPWTDLLPLLHLDQQTRAEITEHRIKLRIVDPCYLHECQRAPARLGSL